MMDRMNDIWRSLRSLPVWVQIWVVGILVPVNVLPFFCWIPLWVRLGLWRRWSCW
jgi:hypothetical protein